MVDQARAGRLSKRIGQIVAHTLEFEVKDSRLDFVTITDVRLTGDLREATIYYTVLNPDLSQTADHAAVEKALNKVRGRVRTAVGAGTGIKFTPSIQFELDTLRETASALELSLEQARLRDQHIAHSARGAKYAGGENPYKTSNTTQAESENE